MAAGAIDRVRSMERALGIEEAPDSASKVQSIHGSPSVSKLPAAIFEELRLEICGKEGSDDGIIDIDDNELEGNMGEIDGLNEWAAAAAAVSDVAAQLKQILPATSWTTALSAVSARPPDGLVSRIRAAVDVEKKKSSTATGRHRSHRHRVWTAHHGGNVDLVQLCIAERANWDEERRVGAHFGRECRVVWVDSMTRLQVGGLLGQGQLLSRLDGMRELAEKAGFERALALCRAAHLPGFGGAAGRDGGRGAIREGGGAGSSRSGGGGGRRSGGGGGGGSYDSSWPPLQSPSRDCGGDDDSPFPRTWVLPDQKIVFIRHVRTARIAALASRRQLPT